MILVAIGNLRRRNNVGDRMTAIGNDDRFSGRRRTDVLAQLVLEDFEADLLHGRKVATKGHFVNPEAPSIVQPLER